MAPTSLPDITRKFLESPSLPPWRLDAVDAQPESNEGSPALDPVELARFFGYSHDLLAILDGRGRVLALSPSADRFLGYPREQLTGVPMMSLVHPDDEDDVRERLRQLAETGAVSDLDGRLRRADGRWLPMRWSLSAHGPGGRIYGVGRDRSGDLRRHEEARNREEAELRLRTAGELHDGVLQMLTAASLQLEVARRLVATDPEAAQEVIRRLDEGMRAEQREMRLFVDEMRLEEPIWAQGRLPLEQRVDDMLHRISAIWGVVTSLDCDVVHAFDAEFERQVLRVIQEAVVNAARHGGAARVSVGMRGEGQAVVIELEDDGHGFPFKGDFTDQELKDQRLGPVSLKRRVGQGGGQMAIRSTPSGARIRIDFPVNHG